MNNSRSDQDIEREHFDALAQKDGEIWWGSATMAGIRRLQRRANIVKEKIEHYRDPRVFELGCGTGAFTKYILETMPLLDLTACDISPECIKVISNRYHGFKNARFLVDDVTMNSSKFGKFDVITGNSVLHHLPVKSSLKYCHELLKDGGCVVFFEPNMMNPQIAVEKNIHFIGKMLQNTKNETAFFRWGLARMLKEAGFKEAAVTPFDFLHPVIPHGLVDFFDKIGAIFEILPFFREFSGSLLITAVKDDVKPE